MPHPKIDLRGPRLEVITGCMFSGKTEELLARLDRYKIAKAEVILLRPEKDIRENETHAGREFQGKTIPIDTTLDTLIDIISKELFVRLQVIAFDEGNFFEEETFVQLCKDLVNQGKIVIVAGLDMTFAEEGYGPMPKLMLLADVLDKNLAICSVCGSPYASRTQRLVNGQPASKKSPRDIVGDEKGRKTEQGVVTYEARCRQCYVPPQ